jgi:Heparinase II/III-like protein/Heparinase II/III N-terminus
MSLRDATRRAAATVRRVGPHPLRLGAHFGHRAYTSLRLRRLRRTYQRRVARAPVLAELRAPDVLLAPAEALPGPLRVAAGRIRREAEALLAHRVHYLGSGWVELGEEIDWQADFKSGHRWQPAFYQDVEVIRLDDDSDAKVPWELSRGHQLLTLARAAQMFEDERFAAELENQIGSWLAANPPGHGINWANPMEVALRAVNWLWAIGTLEAWRPLEPALRREVSASLQAHGRHVAANLEGGPALRGNHYLADNLGLLALGSALPDDPQSRRWHSYARSRFEREITAQVHEDGVGFEASLPYHGLALEMFLLARVIAQRSGSPLSDPYDRRVARMLDVSRAVRQPGGRIPQLGDSDSGRVVPAGFARPARHDALLWLGASEVTGLRPLAGDVDEEVAWTLGLAAWDRAGDLPPAPPPPSAFPHGGLYVLRGADAHVVVDCGDVGQNGWGGHAHNDLLSYELAYRQPLVVDSGTYAYTSDPAARNAFRATAAHNVLALDRQEINPIAPERLFTLDQFAHPRIRHWEDGPSAASLVAEHDGFCRLHGGPVHRRRLELDKASGRLEVVDELLGRGSHLVESFVHLAPGVDVTPSGPGRFELAGAGGEARIELWGRGLDVEVTEGWVSDGYGRRERAPVFVARSRIELPARLGYRFVPGRGGRSADGTAVAEVRA